ncbi:NAD(P)-dependent oxidoreductase [Kitasatospora herbaricolor]|uniref:dTDP-4-dehydrorhamnose reductase n=1 Tax=Kitasatospora herbaricolor TaxID=68217 RepID=UPI00174D0090|nr:dTDP-4-dehydrorhamnose reductase [Kitasatospora herbaricolor]MDQ0308889.1 dTDP-4-dehydrorhamnose reductase [Kitasatospora herbaricolor]GGV09623.1 NAD(P)-dependent oxidoreductase [Kitasatospora herbaricolor]
MTANSSDTVRWLVTGAAGMLGRDLLAELAADPRAEVTALGRADLDITDPDAVLAAVQGHDVVVNCAAWTDVDGAESAEEAATAVNGAGVRNLAAACAKTGARLLHVSTDYVLPGDATEPYAEDAPTSPVNAYGRSKLVGEQAVAELLPETGYTVRTAWLYGQHGPNFVATMLKLAAQRDSLDVVEDQHGQPTWSSALARQLVALGTAALAGRAPAGVYHGTGGGRTTWFGLARETYRLAGLDPERIRPTDSTAFVRPAVRPAFSVLAHGRWAQAGLAPLPAWRDQLAEALGTPVFTELALAARTTESGRPQ